jgi:outer membrane protein assembly factor BamB
MGSLHAYVLIEESVTDSFDTQTAAGVLDSVLLSDLLSTGVNAMRNGMVGIIFFATICMATLKGADVRVEGWRGDGTGRYPNATPPLEWYRISKTLRGLSCQAKKPKPNEEPDKDAIPSPYGFFGQWLVLGALDGPDPKTALDQPTIPNEAEVQPDEGVKVGAVAWQSVTVQDSLLDLMSIFKEMPGKLAYAHTYVHSKAGGKLMLQVNHKEGLKIWLNGNVIYNNPAGYVYNAGQIPVDLVKGWNRLLVKLTPNLTRDNEFTPECFVRLRCWSGDPADTYETKNIVWASPMPNRCVSCPVVVGERIFLGSAPFDLVCLNKKDGKILWVRSNNYSDAADEEERKAHTDIFDKIAPLAKRRDALNLACTTATPPSDTELEEKSQVDFEIFNLITKTNKEKYKTGEQDAGFYSAPTACSDGKFVYAWFAHGVLACYDFEGNRKWIRCDDKGTQHHGFFTSPVLAAGKVIIFMNEVLAFDAGTGAPAWNHPLEHGLWYGSSFVTRVGETEAVVVGNGGVLRAADGVELSKGLAGHWSASPVVDAGHIYLVDNDSGQHVLNLPVGTDKAKPAEMISYGGDAIRSPGWPAFLNRYSAASQLIHDGLSYTVCSGGTLTVMDLAKCAEQKPAVLYQKLLPVDSWGLYQPYPYQCGVCASPTLAGKHIFIIGNCGTTLVLEPGPQFKIAARNKIESTMFRKSPWNYTFGYWPQHLEGTASSPVFEGGRMYLRAEGHLYCIGEK